MTDKLYTPDNGPGHVSNLCDLARTYYNSVSVPRGVCNEPQDHFAHVAWTSSRSTCVVYPWPVSRMLCVPLARPDVRIIVLKCGGHETQCVHLPGVKRALILPQVTSRQRGYTRWSTGAAFGDPSRQHPPTRTGTSPPSCVNLRRTPACTNKMIDSKTAKQGRCRGMRRTCGTRSLPQKIPSHPAKSYCGVTP